ncbi:MAG: nucleotidyltransferase domain-containing protein [Patescibacteria group bacterium]|jgi:predicted nucleotidyltransferase|nr:nucleotidyltransferase domain-containing protein [Patescibacteria group bacterium]
MNYQRRVKNLKVLGYLLQIAPFVRAVILTGSMTIGSTNESSDIDLLIVTKERRLYLARFFVTLLTTLTGLRRTPKTKNPAGKFCLNYYLAADNLDIRPHTARCARFHRHIIRVWDKDGICERIYRQNQWLRSFEPKIVDENQIAILKNNFPLDRWLTLSLIRLPLEILLTGKLGNFAEDKFSKWQMSKILNSKTRKDNKKTIVVRKNELRLHPKKQT